jgi:hypothetical protein
MVDQEPVKRLNHASVVGLSQVTTVVNEFNGMDGCGPKSQNDSKRFDNDSNPH